MTSDPAAIAATGGRLTAISRLGWTDALGPLQLAVWLAHNAAADAAGVSPLSTAGAAGAAGCRDTRKVRDVQRRLRELGLLDTVRPGGSSDKARHRVLVPAGGPPTRGGGHVD